METIEAGIDLGTTNSAIAFLEGVTTEVVRHDGRDYLPSVIWMDRHGGLHVGDRARERAVEDGLNVAARFKRLMGSRSPFAFERSQKTYQPEDLSAEVLRALKAGYSERRNRDLRSAVISIPANYGPPQVEATTRAAELAGFKASALVQEPVAAALAYGFQRSPKNEYWLVYDWGGGTFDVALVQIQDGLPRVIGHGGHETLGGSDIDRRIVEDVFLPQLGRPDRPRHVQRLQIEAEKAKIRLSQADVVEDEVELRGERGAEPAFVSYRLTRQDLENISRPLVLQTVQECRRVLSQARLNPGDVARVILVGGPTMMPIVRSVLQDSREGLGLTVDTTVDPMTAVARGAAIFAGSRLQRRSRGSAAILPEQPGMVRLELDYAPMGESFECPVGGRLVASSRSFSGYTIEFRDDERAVAWRSGKYSVDPSGAFVLTVLGETGRQARFSIHLFDPSGNRVATTPAECTYTVGMTFAEVPLNMDIRVALRGGDSVLVLPHGSQIPRDGLTIRLREPLIQSTAVARGNHKQWLLIPVLGGRSEIATRNKLLGSLKFAGHEMSRDLPAGSEVEFSLSINQNGQLSASAYVPILDQDFAAEFQWKDDLPGGEQLAAQLETTEQLLGELQDQAAGAGDSKAQETLSEISKGGILADLRKALPGVTGNPDAAQRCKVGIDKVKQWLDEAESRLRWSVLAQEAADAIEDTAEIVEKHGDEGERRRFAAMKQELLRVLRPEYDNVVRQRLSEIYALGFTILNRQPSYLTSRFHFLEKKLLEMTDQDAASRLIEHGRKAIAGNDTQALAAVNRQLTGLVKWRSEENRGYGSTVIK